LIHCLNKVVEKIKYTVFLFFAKGFKLIHCKLIPGQSTQP